MGLRAVRGRQHGADPRDGPGLDGLVSPRPGRGDRRAGPRPGRSRDRPLRAVDGDVLLFGHAHCLRALAARWLGQPVVDGRLYRLDTGTLSVLAFERETPVIVHWNATGSEPLTT